MNVKHAEPIHFGTDGWRAIIGRDFTEDNVMRVAYATAHYMKEKGMKSVIIGHDFRFGGRMFAEAAARVCAERGLTVYCDNGFASTPMVSLGCVTYQADMGIIITASHNPPSYNGFKLKSHLGGPALPDVITAIEERIPDVLPEEPASFHSYVKADRIQPVDLQKTYLDHVHAHFDMKYIHASGLHIAYDAMYGAGQRVMRALFPGAVLLHCDNNPGFGGRAPEPILRNLPELQRLLEDDHALTLGIATDGDADRIGLFDENGTFVDSHHMLLLLLRYMVEYRKERGRVTISFSVTDKMKKLADHYGLPVDVTKIGFKYIAEIMAQEDVVVGGEESGGLAIKGHIPERDGIWIGLTLLDYMARTGKKLSTLIREVYDIVGSFAFDRNDLHLTELQKQEILHNCASGSYKHFGPYTVTQVEDTDGYRFHLGPDHWVMLRASGTEPLLRVYAQAPDMGGVKKILDAVSKQIL
jgi:phosphomannomutase